MKLLSRMMVVCLLCALLVACTKQEDSFGGSDLLAGTWKWEKTVTNVQTFYPAPSNSYYLRFSKDGSFIFLRDSIVLRAGNYTVSGEDASLISRPEKLTLKLSDDPGHYDVTLNGAELILGQNSRFDNSTMAYYQRQ
ncbi:hypothetical protein JMG10_14185 [Nostoc ellipsosporum NOK]|nr:hypothetical protein [Nostoc ellipsosporum NOK]